MVHGCRLAVRSGPPYSAGPGWWLLGLGKAVSPQWLLLLLQPQPPPAAAPSQCWRGALWQSRLEAACPPGLVACCGINGAPEGGGEDTDPQRHRHRPGEAEEPTQRMSRSTCAPSGPSPSSAPCHFGNYLLRHWALAAACLPPRSQSASVYHSPRPAPLPQSCRSPG